jgi:hypothetical protein
LFTGAGRPACGSSTEDATLRLSVKSVAPLDKRVVRGRQFQHPSI